MRMDGTKLYTRRDLDPAKVTAAIVAAVRNINIFGDITDDDIARETAGVLMADYFTQTDLRLLDELASNRPATLTADMVTDFRTRLEALVVVEPATPLSVRPRDADTARRYAATLLAGPGVLWPIGNFLNQMADLLDSVLAARRAR